MVGESRVQYLCVGKLGVGIGNEPPFAISESLLSYSARVCGSHGGVSCRTDILRRATRSLKSSSDTEQPASSRLLQQVWYRQLAP